ncbi:hypothetical protein [Streptomyces sp. LN699]|uniref:hypothetical protein n=1 Tax=Streptomyces sp. LN699 TaxID=3112981 RepID=UPI00370FBCBE
MHLLAYGAATQDGVGGVQVDVGQVSARHPRTGISRAEPLSSLRVFWTSSPRRGPIRWL